MGIITHVVLLELLRGFPGDHGSTPPTPCNPAYITRKAQVLCGLVRQLAPSGGGRDVSLSRPVRHSWSLLIRGLDKLRDDDVRVILKSARDRQERDWNDFACTAILESLIEFKFHKRGLQSSVTTAFGSLLSFRFLDQGGEVKMTPWSETAGVVRFNARRLRWPIGGMVFLDAEGVFLIGLQRLSDIAK